eukprot:scaffold16767_cov57-Phaeocystis_antarctica.AAC.4
MNTPQPFSSHAGATSGRSESKRRSTRIVRSAAVVAPRSAALAQIIPNPSVDLRPAAEELETMAWMAEPRNRPEPADASPCFRLVVWLGRRSARANGQHGAGDRHRRARPRGRRSLLP